MPRSCGLERYQIQYWTQPSAVRSYTTGRECAARAPRAAGAPPPGAGGVPGMPVPSTAVAGTRSEASRTSTGTVAEADETPVQQAQAAIVRTVLSGRMARLDRLVFCLVALGPARPQCANVCAPGAW